MTAMDKRPKNREVENEMIRKPAKDHEPPSRPPSRPINRPNGTGARLPALKKQFRGLEERI
jgi:hypothetical protein